MRVLERSPKFGCSEDQLNSRPGFPESATRGKFPAAMFLRKTERRKNGKTHLYWSVVENRRLDNGRVVQRHVLYLGEINSSQAEAWRRAIEVFDEDAGAPAFAVAVSRRSLRSSRRRRRRSSAAAQRDAASPAAPVGRLLARRRSVARTAARSLLGRAPAGKPQGHALGSTCCKCWRPIGSSRRAANGGCIANGSSTAPWPISSAPTSASPKRTSSTPATTCCIAHKQALFSHLTQRWRDLFNASFDVLLYDLTSTYFEVNASDLPEGSKRRHGYSRDKRPDCPQLVIALVVTPEGLPLAYEVLPGNTADSKTLRSFLAKIESQYGKARRVWVMDRGVPTEEVLAEMRASDPPVQLSGGNAEGTPDAPRKATHRQAVAQGARRRRGQASGARRRTLRLRPKRRPRQPRSARCGVGN